MTGLAQNGTQNSKEVPVYPQGSVYNPLYQIDTSGYKYKINSKDKSGGEN